MSIIKTGRLTPKAGYISWEWALEPDEVLTEQKKEANHARYCRKVDVLRQGGYISMKEVAALLEVSDRTIWAIVKSGAFTDTRKMLGVTYVNKEEFIEFYNSRKEK